MIGLVRKLWERITRRGPSHGHESMNHFKEYQKIFAIERGKQNTVSRRLDIIDNAFQYNCIYFSGSCTHTYFPVENKTSIRFCIGDWELPKYYKNNISGNTVIKILPFKHEGYSFDVTASQNYISIEFNKLYDGIYFMNSYDQLNILRDHTEIKKKIKKFVKDNKHLNYECKDNIIELDISHI